MALTITNCADTIRQTTNQELPLELTVDQMVAEAGRWLFTYPWSWLSRQTTLGVTSGDNYVLLSSLPALSVRDVFYTETQAYKLIPTTMDDIVSRRTELTSSGAPTFFALHWRDDADGVPVRSLEFDTAFSDTDADLLTIIYSVEWPVGATTMPIPGEFEGLFLHALRAVARGYVDEDMGTVSPRLEALRQSSMFADLARRDVALLPRRGFLRGGGVAGQLYRQPWPNYPSVRLT